MLNIIQGEIEGDDRIGDQEQQAAENFDQKFHLQGQPVADQVNTDMCLTPVGPGEREAEQQGMEPVF